MAKVSHNFRNWKKGWDAEVQERMKDAEFFVKSVVVQALSDAQIISPVILGTYRANHTISIDKLAGVVHEVGTVNEPSETPGALALAEIEKANMLLKPFDFWRRKVTKVFLQNHLVYAVPIEEGSSIQEPAGVYKRVEQRAKENIKRGDITRGGI